MAVPQVEGFSVVAEASVHGASQAVTDGTHLVSVTIDYSAQRSTLAGYGESPWSTVIDGVVTCANASPVVCIVSDAVGSALTEHHGKLLDATTGNLTDLNVGARSSILKVSLVKQHPRVFKPRLLLAAVCSSRPPVLIRLWLISLRVKPPMLELSSGSVQDLLIATPEQLRSTRPLLRVNVRLRRREKIGTDQ